MAIRLVPTGSLIKEYLAVNGLKQKDVARRMQYSEKQVSLVLQGKRRVSKEFAESISALLPGTTPDYWLRYDAKYWEQERRDEIEAASRNYAELNKALGLQKIFGRAHYSKTQQLDLLEEIANTDDLMGYFIESPAPKVHPAYLKGATVSESFLNLWLEVLLYYRAYSDFAEYEYAGNERLRTLMDSELRNVLFEDSSNGFEDGLRHFCELAGLNLILLEKMPSTYIRGMAFPWEGKLYVVLTDRFKSIEFTAFAFIHELMHILNGDITIESTDVQFLGNEFDHENLATQAAIRWLLGVDQEALIQEVSEAADKPKALMEWSKRLGVPPGIIVTILQHLGILDYSAQRQFLHPYRCTPDFQF